MYGGCCVGCATKNHNDEVPKPLATPLDAPCPADVEVRQGPREVRQLLQARGMGHATAGHPCTHLALHESARAHGYSTQHKRTYTNTQPDHILHTPKQTPTPTPTRTQAPKPTAYTECVEAVSKRGCMSIEILAKHCGDDMVPRNPSSTTTPCAQNRPAVRCLTQPQPFLIKMALATLASVGSVVHRPEMAYAESCCQPTLSETPFSLGCLGLRK